MKGVVFMDENAKDNRINDSNNSKNNSDSKVFIRILVISLLITFAFNVFSVVMTARSQSELEYSKFIKLVQEGKVESVEFQSDKLIVKPYKDKLQDGDQKLVNGATVFYTGRVGDDELVKLLKEKNVEFYAPIQYNSPIISFALSWILPLLIMYLGFTFIMRIMAKHMGGGLGGFGKSNAKVYMEKTTGVTCALLVGPPGTGKTLLAKAVAGEAKVTFMSLSGSDFEEMFVGVGASRVRELFKSAQENAPCIVFIDELDAVGAKRDNRLGNNDQTLNQLLSEMDGFDTSNGVVILAATNRPEVLDKALLRPGRFDRRIIVEAPDLKGRVDVLKVHAAKVQMDNDIDYEKIALATSGATGADLANIVNEAALRAVRMGREKVLQEDLMESVEVVIAGKEKKDRILSEKEKRVVAVHEVGHALAAALQNHSQPVQKITIIPRTMGALGYTMQMPEEERYLMSKEEILAKIVTYLAGRSAEEIEFNSITTGASNDIEMATKLARNMITLYGMSDEFDMMALENVENRYLDGTKVSLVGEHTVAEVDKAVLDVIKTCHIKAKNIIEEQKTALEEISNFLFEKETISGEEFMDILKKYVDFPEKEEKKEESISEENNKPEE